ncbi:MAG: phosphate ABC transporter permease PstA [Methanomassiliicoccaceae archaeon]|nr:phosphate ABC transporter permease PstA [Methanomassiliicoccaceae archaeon]
MSDGGSIKKVKKFHHDTVMKYILMAVASVTVLIIFFIILFILGNGIGAVKEVGIWNFLTGFTWKPSIGSYGAMPLITGTILVTVGAILIALPLGLGSAIFISEIAPKRIRNILKPVCEIFAGIPSVVYGFFGLIVLVPLLRNLFPDHLLFGTSWLAGSIILGIMALPTIVSVSEDAMRAVPKSYREASMAMGATRWETTRKVVVPAAISGIAAATILGIGRAIGETMAVMMVTGNSAIIPAPLWNFFEMLRTITATLALEMPDVVSGSTHYSALFLLALVLMLMVLAINFIAKMIIKRSKRKFGDPTVPATSSKKMRAIASAVKNTPRTIWGLMLISVFMMTFILSAVIQSDMLVSFICGIIVAELFLIFTIGILLVPTGDERIPGKLQDTSKRSYMISRYSSKLIRSAVLTGAFVFVWMMASLFADTFVSVLTAFVFLAAMIAVIPLAKRLGSGIREKIAHISLTGVVAVVVLVLIVLIVDIVSKGLPALSFDFIFGYPTDGGLGGGIFPAIVGTIQLVVGTMMIAFPLGIVSGIYLAEYAKNTRSTKIIREAIDILNGTPSVVFGLFGMAALVIFLGVGYALIAGCITLAVMVLPVIIRTTEEAVLAVPKELREASLALGASKWETTMKVVVPAAFGGVVTGLILSLGRAAGETAPILFTAVVVFRSSISFSLADPVMALPYHLYFLASEVPGSTTMQYGTALVLLLLVLFMFAMASVVRYKYNKNIKW